MTDWDRIWTLSVGEQPGRGKWQDGGFESVGTVVVEWAEAEQRIQEAQDMTTAMTAELARINDRGAAEQRIAALEEALRGIEEVTRVEAVTEGFAPLIALKGIGKTCRAVLSTEDTDRRDDG